MLKDKHKFLHCKDSYMQFKIFGGPKSMEEYAKKRDAQYNRRENFRIKYQADQDKETKKAREAVQLAA